MQETGMAEPDDDFPLPLSDFEFYVLRDESPEYPMVMILRIHLEGAVHEEPFRDALQFTLRSNPLLQSIVRENHNGPQWHLLRDSPLPLSVKHYPGEEPPLACESQPIDIHKVAGVQFELRRCKARSVLICHFHHACVDGLGAIRFLSDVFAVYARTTATTDADRPKVQLPTPETLLHRGVIPQISRTGGKKVSWTEWIKGPLRFLTGKVYKIAANDNHQPSEESNENVLHTTVLPRSVQKRLKKLAAASQVSTNDLCMMVYLRQLAWWTRADPSARDHDLFRILMPVSTRTADHDNISACNMISYVFQPIRRRDCRNPVSLLNTIHRRSSQMINGNEGAVVLKLFSLLRRVPGLFRVSRRFQSTFATAVLANVGELKRVFGTRFPLQKGRIIAGNVVIDRIDGIAPLRKNTNIVVSFGSYGGEMILNLRANPTVFSSSDAEQFLQQIRERLTMMAEAMSLTAVETASTTLSTQHSVDDIAA